MKLNDKEALEIEGAITEEELGQILKKTKNDSSPGASGFDYNFYKFFWIDLKSFITRSANYSYEAGKLPTSQRYGIISVIPKGDKNKELISNWRPLCLLNSIYKLISGAIAKRINSKLDKIINYDQCGFVGGRFLGDCIRTTNDILEWGLNKKKMGLLLLIDFHKAFDSINFSFISKSLSFFGFKENIQRWIWILLHNFSASTIHAGNISEKFDILVGCRQGDPVAPPLFILAIEILCIKLRNSAKIKGYKIDNIEFLLSLYADDCTIFLEYNAENLRNCIDILKEFFKVSGLKIHIQKTKCIIFGEKPETDMNLCPDLGLKWEDKFTLLGINFDAFLEKMEENFDLKIKEIQKTIDNWRFRLLTPLGRCVVAKTLLLSKLSHLAMVLPSLTKEKYKSIENLIYKYIWKGTDKVCREDAKKSFRLGGLNFPDIEISWKAFRLSWLRRILNGEAKWKKILDLLLKCAGILDLESLFELGIADIAKLAKKIKSRFWSDTLSIIKPIMLELVKQYPEEIINCTIWGSDWFTRNRTLTYRKHFVGLPSQIDSPGDLMKRIDIGVDFITYEECVDRYGQCDPDIFLSMKYLIKTAFDKVGLDLNVCSLNYPRRPALIFLANLTIKGCSGWTKLLKGKFVSNNTRKLECKWNDKLGNIQGISFWNNCYRNTEQIFFNNKIKWFYYQIVRGTLKTNNIISKFKRDVVPECTFCEREEENILHLFWNCTIVSDFIRECGNLINTKIEHLVPIFSRKEFIFGLKDQNICSVGNYYALHLKYFIWISRCKKNTLSVQGFINWWTYEMKLDLKFSHNSLFFIENAISGLI